MTGAEPRTEIRLFGPMTVMVGGRSVAGAPTGPARQLLAYLMVHHGRRLRREALIERIWEDGPSPSRAAFNTTLWRLRRFLDRVPDLSLREDGEAVELTLEAGAACDWHALRDALAGWPGTGAAALEAALDRCSGTFVEEVDAHWALASRETAQNAYLAALTCLMHAAAEAGRYEQALARALAILELDPFREAVHAEAMWLLVLTGQRARAIGRHRDFVRLLRDELGIGPMSETTALFRYVLDGLEAPDAAPPHPVAFFGLCEAIDRSRSDVYATIRHSFARS